MDLKEQKPQQIFSGTAWQADQIKDLLMDNEIEAFMGDEIWGTDALMEHASDMAGGVNVYVARDSVEDARIIVERYYEESTDDDYQ